MLITAITTNHPRSILNSPRTKATTKAAVKAPMNARAACKISLIRSKY
jgi:hypothetical protein